MRLYKFIFVILLSISLRASANQPDTLRILALGNSFSEDAIENNLYDIARLDGRCAIIGNMFIGGCSLERHNKNLNSDEKVYRYCKIEHDGTRSRVDKYSLSEAFADERWDVVSLQQASPLSGIYESYEPYLANLISAVRARLPKARIVFHQTWAYAKDSKHSGYGKYGWCQDSMYVGIVAASRQVCEKYGIAVIPSGTAIQNVRNTVMGNSTDLVTRDGYHLNHTAGRYTAACTWYAALFGRKATGNTWRIPHMTDEMSLLTQCAADAAVANPWDVTVFGFKKASQNRIEERVGEYVLPDNLVCYDGTKVKNVRTWEQKRAPELLQAFRTEEYGISPSVKYFETEVVEVKKDALDGLATRKRVLIWLDKEHKVKIDLLVYTPNSVKSAPLFLGINFKGNAACTYEEDIYIPDVSEQQKLFGCAVLGSRGEHAFRWPLKTILSRGYGVATFYRGDVFPDFWHTGSRGVQKIYPEAGKAPESWGAISVWAWSLSRAMDYLLIDADIDSKRVAVIGHSRLGKSALWAAAQDKRFAMVVANNSGCSGASLARRNFGETIEEITWKFPYWFCDNYKKYIHNPSTLPFDQHSLLALIAPRPICLGTAESDMHSDPYGEKISLEAAKDVYELYRATERIHYHIRPGVHNIYESDWIHYLDHADKWMK